MSWLSKTLDKTRNSTDSLGKKLGLNESQRKYFREGVATLGGGMALQYEYSRNKGMNSDEATKNSVTGGAQYQDTRTMQKMREAQENLAEQDQLLAVQQAADSRKQRLQGQVTVRRRARAEQRSTKGGTLLTGSIGLPGSTTGSGPGATLLGG